MRKAARTADAIAVHAKTSEANNALAGHVANRLARGHMTCTCCEQAKVRSCAMYRANCKGCTARSIARSFAAWNALHKNGNGNRKPLTEMVNSLLAEIDAKESRKLVLD
jgi:transposase